MAKVIAAQGVMGKLIEARTARGLTQQQLAEKLGTTQSAIARLEAGRFDPKLSTLLNYAKAVGATLEVN